MSFRVYAVDVAADTAVQVCGRDDGAVSTKNVSLRVKLSFIPSSTAAVVTIAHDAATLAAGDGFPLRATDPAEADVFQGDDEIELAPQDNLWVQATEAGVLYVLAV